MCDWETQKATGLWPVSREIKGKTVKTKGNVVPKQEFLDTHAVVSTAGATPLQGGVTRRLQGFQKNNR